MTSSEGVSGMVEACNEEGLTPQGFVGIPDLVLIQGVLGDGGRRIWPHEKPGEYMKCTRKTSIHNQPYPTILYVMACASASPSLTVGINLPTYL